MMHFGVLGVVIVMVVASPSPAVQIAIQGPGSPSAAVTAIRASVVYHPLPYTPEQNLTLTSEQAPLLHKGEKKKRTSCIYPAHYER